MAAEFPNEGEKWFGSTLNLSEAHLTEPGMENSEKYLPKEWTPKQLQALSDLTAIYTSGLMAMPSDEADRLAHFKLYSMQDTLSEQFGPDLNVISAVTSVAMSSAEKFVSNLEVFKERVVSVSSFDNS